MSEAKQMDPEGNNPEVRVPLSTARMQQLRSFAVPDGSPKDVEEGPMFRLLLETTPDLVFWKDAQLVYRGCNYNYARVLGFRSPTDVVGLTDVDVLMDAELGDAYAEIDREVLASDLPYISYDFMSQQPGHATGQWVRTFRYPIKNELGEVSGVLGIVRQERDATFVPAFRKTDW